MTWIGKPTFFTYLFTPAELVAMRKPERLSNPPQVISSVGVSHLTQLHRGSRQFVGCQTKRQRRRQPPHQSLKRNGDWNLVSKDEVAITSENHMSEPIPSARWGNEEARLAEGTLGPFELLLSGHLSWDNCVKNQKLRT